VWKSKNLKLKARKLVRRLIAREGLDRAVYEKALEIVPILGEAD
jgi:pimeloyl-CoA synthetase